MWDNLVYARGRPRRGGHVKKMETEIVTADLPSSRCGATRSGCSGHLSSISRPPPGSTPTPTSAATTDAGSRTGSALSPARSGWGVADRYALRVGIDAIEARIKALDALLRQQFTKRPVTACTISAWSGARSSRFAGPDARSPLRHEPQRPRVPLAARARSRSARGRTGRARG
jgi:hypothetical protein